MNEFKLVLCVKLCYYICVLFKWPVGEAVNTLPSQGNIHGSKSHTGYQIFKMNSNNN